ncbi:hypothetical protein Tsp_05282 [Trichinella spiralis]|uniref:hypothetical protein n=1 Tax=Trichinella spiralis TaxID=6334 RepID=UPI0001EFEC89|nr:hypothetical protein Tsp_05282 [Trichinella spiralis]
MHVSTLLRIEKESLQTMQMLQAILGKCLHSAQLFVLLFFINRNVYTIFSDAKLVQTLAKYAQNLKTIQTKSTKMNLSENSRLTDIGGRELLVSSSIMTRQGFYHPPVYGSFNFNFAFLTPPDRPQRIFDRLPPFTVRLGILQ